LSWAKMVDAAEMVLVHNGSVTAGAASFRGAVRAADARRSEPEGRSAGGTGRRAGPRRRAGNQHDRAGWLLVP